MATLLLTSATLLSGLATAAQMPGRCEDTSSSVVGRATRGNFSSRDMGVSLAKK
ncbi:MAG: hypothetical protein O3C63_00465 [Cyanobacteria bacterium]|nr:hypothetical protein [Cyanobacteriota bacterium]MDA1021345.1 hypothetical protein [Cyanobacteriota bacterium]